jgi:Na+-transporting NADH:ubiquinone oxidoreductase subunit C
MAKKLDTNSNAYTIMYASIMVVIVAVVLAFAHSSLKETQEQNVRLDKKKQILSAINVNIDGQNAEELYAQYIKKDLIIDAKGTVVKEEGGFDNQNSDNALTLYLAEVNGEIKYIIPLNGNGLWGPIWGYIALNADKNTVFGVYFSHASETPGLGAEIVKPAFKNPFKGKQVMKDGTFTSISVVKKGKLPENGGDYVNGISGGTVTSTAVNDMLYDCIGAYEQFLTKK